MITVIIQSSNISDKGHVFAASERNKSDEAYLSQLFKKAEQHTSAEVAVAASETGAFYIQPSVQEGTGRECFNIVLLQNIDWRALSETERARVTFLINNFLINSLSKIRDEYSAKNELSRSLIFKSAIIQQFEDELAKEKITELPVLQKKKTNEKSYFSKTIIVGLFIAVLLSFSFNTASCAKKKNVTSPVTEFCRRYGLNEKDLSAKLKAANLSEKLEKKKSSLANFDWYNIFLDNADDIKALYGISGKKLTPADVEKIKRAGVEIYDVYSILRQTIIAKENEIKTHQVDRIIKKYGDIKLIYEYAASHYKQEFEGNSYKSDELVFFSDVDKRIAYELHEYLFSNEESFKQLLGGEIKDKKEKLSSCYSIYDLRKLLNEDSYFSKMLDSIKDDLASSKSKPDMEEKNKVAADKLIVIVNKVGDLIEKIKMADLPNLESRE